MNDHEPDCRSHWWGWGRPPSTSWWTCSRPKVARPSFNSRKLYFTLKTPEFETSLNLFHIVNKYITQGWLVISKLNRWHHWVIFMLLHLSPRVPSTREARIRTKQKSPVRKAFKHEKYKNYYCFGTSSKWAMFEILSRYEATRPLPSWNSSKVFCKVSNDCLSDFLSSLPSMLSSSSSSSSIDSSLAGSFGMFGLLRLPLKHSIDTKFKDLSRFTYLGCSQLYL